MSADGQHEHRPSADAGGDRPTVFIAALPRTGSTLLAELLTSLPTSFVFREPGLARGECKIKPDDAERFAPLGIDLNAFAHNAAKPRGVLRRTPSELVSAFASDLLPALRRIVGQIGIKEVDLAGWERYLQHLPDIRVVLLGRDPRDVYLSLADRTKMGFGFAGERGSEPGAGGFPIDPERAAAHINGQFTHQRALADRCAADGVPTLKLTYEQLVTDPEIFETVRTFTDSPLTEPGDAGALNATNPRRRHEADLHDGAVTTRRLERWRQLATTDPARGGAEATFALLDDYNAFWGYADAASLSAMATRTHAT
jgi:hypothetical protein